MRIQSLAWLDANAAWALLVGGLLLIYWELCRPGTIVPGSVGGACLLVAVAWFTGAPPRALALLLFVAGWVALGAEAWWRCLPWLPPGLAGAALLAAAAIFAAVRWFVAIPLALALSSATVILGSAAIRAYLAKRI